jgi:hypothetical protein
MNFFVIVMNLSVQPPGRDGAAERSCCVVVPGATATSGPLRHGNHKM